MSSSTMIVHAFQRLLDSSTGSLGGEHDVSFFESLRDASSNMNPDEKQGSLCQDLFHELQLELRGHRRLQSMRCSSTDVARNFQGNLRSNIQAENLHPNQINVRQGKHSDACNRTRSSIRELFPSTRVSDVLHLVLTPLLNDRVETRELLPATQDEEANDEVLKEKAALSLTIPALQAGRLYAHLLGRPGALGSGLVDLESLTALVSLIRRWSLECCGREREALVKEQQGLQTKRRHDDKLRSPRISSLKKTIRKGDKLDEFTAVDFDGDGENGEEDISNEVDYKFDNVLSLGTLVALEVCKVAKQAEFTSWSSESREMLLDGIVAAMGTAAALSVGGDHENSCLSFIIQEGRKSFEQCLAGDASIANDPQHQQTRHESAVVILRGLMHLMMLKIILPNGERGLRHAHDVAGRVTAVLMKKIKAAEPAIVPLKAGVKTPNKKSRRRSSIGSIQRTPRSAAPKRRPSLDGVAPMTSPVLKKKIHTRLSELGFSNRPSTPRGLPAVFLGLLQKLATRRSGLEKAALRRSTVQTIQNCLHWMPQAERTHFLKYVNKMCHSKVSVHRLVACELLGAVLSQPWLEKHKNDPSIDGEICEDDDPVSPLNYPQNITSTLPQAMWKALQGRLVDRISSVRAAAAASLEYAASSDQSNNSSCQFLLRSQDVDELLIALRKRATKDETATVRKTAIAALTKLLVANKDKVSSHYISAICDLCQDPSLFTRGAAASSLTKLLQVFTEDETSANDDVEFIDMSTIGLIESGWSTCVLPMVLDEEISAKAVNSFQDVIVKPILQNGPRLRKKQESAWRILAKIGYMNAQQGASKGASTALDKALLRFMKDDNEQLHVQLMREVLLLAEKSVECDDLEEEVAVGVWCLLASLVSIENGKQKKRSSKFGCCARAWGVILARHLKAPESLWLKCSLKSSLIALSKSSATLDYEQAENCRSALLDRIITFSFPPDVVGSAISAMFELTISVDSSQEQNESKNWISTALTRCEEEISMYVLQACTTTTIPTSDKSREQNLVRALFTAGELSVVGFSPEDDEKQTLQSFHVPPSNHLKELVQILLADKLPGTDDRKNPVSIRSHAFTVLGKFCLRDETLARNSLTLLARELHPSFPGTNPSIQSNALLVLGDLCVQYTNMTDRYLPVMASCLQNGSNGSGSLDLLDRSHVVRKHAILILSSLLLQDYIKWRGLLFHRFLVACSDFDEEVATLAETILSGPLWVRSPKLFFNHFVESIFVLNKCTAHPIYIAAASQGDGGSGVAVGFEGIELDGRAGEYRRRQMYDFLLSKLSDEEKIGITARLAKEVLGSAIETSGDLSRVCVRPPSNMATISPRLLSAWNVLIDTFYVLTHEAIKVRKFQDDPDSAIIDDPNFPSATRQVTVAKSRLLSKISLKHMMEIVMPVLCTLKVKLQGSNSPLLKDLMLYLVVIYQNYKTEVKEFLANDPVLLQEIEFDARKNH